MGNKNNRHKGIKTISSSTQKNSVDFDTLQKQRLELETVERDLVEKTLRSTDPHSIMKAQNYLQTLDQFYNPNNPNDKDIKAFLYSPEMEYYNGTGYRQPLKSVSYQTLRRMARTPIIKTIIGTRVDQVAGFSEPSESEQEKGWMVRKKAKRRSATKDLGDTKIIDYIENFILNGGDGVSKYDFEGFDSTLKAIAKDSLEVDQMCLELIPNLRGKLSRYVPVDGATIQLVDSTLQDKNQLPKKNGFYPKFTQVYMNQPYTYFYPWEMTFGVRNKTTDIYSNGYGISELEDMVQIVTWILYGTQYNGNFFSQGSNPKGFFSIEGSVAPSALSDFKSMWRNTIAGVQNSHKVPVIESGGAKINWIPMQMCLDGETYVLEKNLGFIKLKDLILTKEIKGLSIWTGETFSDARGLQTEEKKKVCRIKLVNGNSITSSLNHKFLVLGLDGKEEWKEQSELKVGDLLCENKKSVPFKNSNFFYKGKEIEEDLWEVLGWLTGDGCWNKNKTSTTFELYYNFEKELSIRDRHFEILNKYGLNPTIVEGVRSEEEIEKIKERHNFSRVSEFYSFIKFYNNDFYHFLKSIGLKDSSEKKNVCPTLIFQKKSNINSYLKGLFSADGSCSTNGDLYLTCHNHKLREELRYLLSCLGYRVSTRIIKESKKFKNQHFKDFILKVNSAETFIKEVGFLQEWKQENSVFCKDINFVRFEFSQVSSVLDLIKERGSLLSESERFSFSELYRNVKGGWQKGTVLSTLRKYCKLCKVDLSKYENYYLTPIQEIVRTDEEEYMYDLEIFDENHKFFSNSIITHNSNHDMEFDHWLEFLTTIACAIFRIDPSECGFNLKSGGQIFGQDGQKERLKHSQSKGLVPILKMTQRIFTKFIVEQIDEDYEFVFTGVEQEDQIAALDMDVKKVTNGFMSMEDGFKKYSGRKFNPDKDTILNSVYQGIKSQELMGGSMNGAAPGEQDQQEPQEENPFEKSLLLSLETLTNKK